MERASSSRLRSLALVSALSLAVLAGVPGGVQPASAVTPGGIFVTGHDSDFHSLAGNVAGARNIINRAIDFVSFGLPDDVIRVLAVSSRIAPPGGHLDSVAGFDAALSFPFDVAAAPGQGVLDLGVVNFNDYDVVLVASDFGGLLRQQELDILNARRTDLVDFVNNGGGLVALAESNSGAHLTPLGGHFDFLPFLASEQALNQTEFGYTVTPFGASLGLTNTDVNNNASHNVFTSTGGMNVVNRDAAGRIMSLAVRGQRICEGGVPSASIDDQTVVEGNSGEVTSMTFTVSLSIEPCGAPVSLAYSFTDGTATGGDDYTAIPGSLGFNEGEPLSKTITVPVLGDDTFEPDETFTVSLSNAQNATLADADGLGTILNDDSPNRAPDCSSVTATPATLWPPKLDLRSVDLTGGTDADGDTVAVQVTGVTQDEALNGTGDGDTAPDAADGPIDSSVLLRAERAGGGDGRVYRVSFDGTDGQGGVCSGTVMVGVPHDMRGGASAVDSGIFVDSFGP